MEPLVFRVPFDPHRCSLNQRLSWRERARRNRVAREAAWYAWIEAGRPTLDVPVTVEITARRARALDADAILTGVKACLDALLCRESPANLGRGVLPDDGPRWVEYGAIRQEIDAR